MKTELWWPPKEIRFTRKQTIWLLQHLPEIQAGNWPRELSTYKEPKVQKSPSRHAYFETPVAVAAELLERLEHAGTKNQPDGLILEAVECWGKSTQALAKYFHCQEWLLIRRYKNALGYVASGPNRRWHDREIKRKGVVVEIRKGETYHQYRERLKKGAKNESTQH